MPFKSKEDREAYSRAYRLANKAKIRAKDKTYYESNKESILEKLKHCRSERPYRSVIDCPDGMVVHHLNHDHNDNRRTNLLVMTQSDHASYHGYMRHGNYEKASQIIYNYEVF